MSFTFRVRRSAGAVVDSDLASELLGAEGIHLFQMWQRVCADLRAAEGRRASPDVLLDLAVEVIRARNAMVRAQIAAGWKPSAVDLNALERDELLVREADDRIL